MEERSSGLILRTRPLTETSLIVHWLTPEAGRLALVAKGARRPKSPFRGKLDLFFEGEFSFVRSRRSELHTLREVALINPHSAIRENLGYFQQAAYGAALVEQVTEAETPLAGVYQIFKDFLEQLPAAPPSPRTIFALELKMLNELGLQPDLDTTHSLGAGAKQILQQLSVQPWETIRRLHLSGDQIVEIRQFLHGFLIYHIGKLPSGRYQATDPVFLG